MNTKTGTEMPAGASNSYKTLVAIFATLNDTERQQFTASGPMATIIEGKSRDAEVKHLTEKETSARMISELQALVASLKLSNASAAHDFSKLTKAELRQLIASHGPAQEIIAELVACGLSEQAVSSAKNLSGEEVFALFCQHPDAMERYEKQCKQAIEAYNDMCKDSFMQALREVELDNKAWLAFQKEDMFKEVATALKVGRPANLGSVGELAGPSPVERALMKSFTWAVPDVPSSPMMAIESTKDAALKASVALSSAGKGNMNSETDRDSVHGRVMRQMSEHYSGGNQ